MPWTPANLSPHQPVSSGGGSWFWPAAIGVSLLALAFVLGRASEDDDGDEEDIEDDEDFEPDEEEQAPSGAPMSRYRRRRR